MEKELLNLALSCGACRAEIIDQRAIILSAEFRNICKSNGCGMYGHCWMCPPDNGDIEALMDKVRTYAKALVYQSVGKIEDSFDFEGMQMQGNAHVQLSQRIETEIRSLLPIGYLHLSCGGCRLCEHCTKPEGKPCRHPDRALSSLEGYGVDVYRTIQSTTMSYINGQNTVTYFGMVLFGG